MTFKIRIGNISKVPDNNVRICNCRLHIYFFIIPCNWMDRIGVWMFSVFHPNSLLKFRFAGFFHRCQIHHIMRFHHRAIKKMDRRKSVMEFSEHWQDLLRFSLNNFALTVRGSDRPPACHSIPRTPQGEGFFRPGALLLALFISFWWCRSGRSGTGATGRHRGLCRGRRSWENPWCRRP